MKRAIRTKGLVLNVILSLIVGYSNAVKTQIIYDFLRFIQK
jgi:hypothetical protein